LNHSTGLVWAVRSQGRSSTFLFGVCQIITTNFFGLGDFTTHLRMDVYDGRVGLFRFSLLFFVALTWNSQPTEKGSSRISLKWTVHVFLGDFPRVLLVCVWARAWRVRVFRAERDFDLMGEVLVCGSLMQFRREAVLFARLCNDKSHPSNAFKVRRFSRF
jgi:hypothetical protein